MVVQNVPKPVEKQEVTVVRVVLQAHRRVYKPPAYLLLQRRVQVADNVYPAPFSQQLRPVARAAESEPAVAPLQVVGVFAQPAAKFGVLEVQN